jgi:hypothetical protein
MGISLTVAALIALLTPLLPAEPRYMVDYLLPRGGPQGERVEVEFHGFSLENPREILFYQQGITAANFVPFAKAGDGFKVQFQIAPNCPSGEHVLRVRTATALSDAVTFWVSPFRTEYEFENKIGENDSIAKARPVPMNATVEGQILPGPEMDRDFYRVEARQGQRISVEVEAVRLGTLHFGGENDLEVFVFDANGKEISHNDDSSLYVQDRCFRSSRRAVVRILSKSGSRSSTRRARPGTARISAHFRDPPPFSRREARREPASKRAFWATRGANEWSRFRCRPGSVTSIISRVRPVRSRPRPTCCASPRTPT